jgi:hypothetical protein
LNELYCVTTPPTTAATTPPTTAAPSYGSLSVTDYPVSNPQSTWYGAQTYEVLDGQYKATGSDITLRKVAIEITSPTFPWSALSTISLWDGSTKVAEVAVTQANLIETTFGTDYTLNISGFTWVIPNGQTKVLTVKATTASVIASASAGSYGFTLKDSSVYTDTAGITYTSGVGTVGAKTYTLAASTQQASFVVSVDANNPLINNIIGSTSGTTKQTVLIFDVQNNSDVNATFNSATSSVTNSGNVVSYELWDGSNMVASVAAPSNTTSTVVAWSNFTLPIAARTTKVLTVKAVIAQLTDSYEGGDTVVVSTPVLTGIDANSNLVHATGTGVSGNTQHIYYKAPSFAFIASSKSVTGSGPNSSPAHTADIVDASITFTVTANNSDVYIPTKATSSAALTVTGGPAAIAATGQIVFSTGTVIATGTATITINTASVSQVYATDTPNYDTGEEVANALAATINASSSLPVTAATTTANDGIVNLTAKIAGYAGNSITYLATTTASTGITVTPTTATNMTGGLNDSTTWTCNSPADNTTNADFWRIPSGNNATCVFSYHAVNTGGTANYYQLVLNGVKWATSATVGATQGYGFTTFKTNTFYLGN